MRLFISATGGIILPILVLAIAVKPKDSPEFDLKIKREEEHSTQSIRHIDELTFSKGPLFDESHKISRNGTEEIEERLVKFEEHLKSFIGADKIDFKRFQLERDDIHQKLRKMTQFSDNSTSIETVNHKDHAKNLTKFMDEASGILEKFNASTKPSNLLICDMVNVYAQILNLQTWNGKFDSRSKNPIDVLLGFHHKIYLIKKKFGFWAVESSETRQLFKELAFRALGALDDLGSQMPYPKHLMARDLKLQNHCSDFDYRDYKVKV